MEGGETVVGTYCMREQSSFNKKKRTVTAKIHRLSVVENESFKYSEKANNYYERFYFYYEIVFNFYNNFASD